MPSERIFSDAGNIVDRKRCVLDPENVDCLVLTQKHVNFVKCMYMHM